MIQEITADPVFEEAYDWICERRKNYHHNDDVWHLRFHWPRMRARIQRELREGRYNFAPLRKMRIGRKVYGIWVARDALVLKCLAIVLAKEFEPRLSPFCYHLAGRGGAKGAVRAVMANAGQATFVFRSDVKSYYASINHDCLMEQLRELTTSPEVLELLRKYLQHLVDEDGVLRQIDTGISIGCPLSPLLGGVYLKPLDDAMAEMGLFYARFMDDWAVLSPDRRSLRIAVKKANEVLEQLKVEKHPDKTFIGRDGFWMTRRSWTPVPTLPAVDILRSASN